MKLKKTTKNKIQKYLDASNRYREAKKEREELKKDIEGDVGEEVLKAGEPVHIPELNCKLFFKDNAAKIVPLGKGKFGNDEKQKIVAVLRKEGLNAFIKEDVDVTAVDGAAADSSVHIVLKNEGFGVARTQSFQIQ